MSIKKAESVGKIWTFYSYKGGVGRSLALANTATLLQEWGYRVLCVDWDLEAPGLHEYFREFIRDEPQGGVLDVIEGVASGNPIPWNTHVRTVDVPGSGQLCLLSAGSSGESYVDRLQTMDWSRLYSDRGLGSVLEEARTEWKLEYDFVFIDSRTGISDLGGICTVQLPDSLAFFFTANQQSLDGALGVVERATRARDALPFDRPRLRALPIVGRFESTVEVDLSQDWLRQIGRRLESVVDPWRHSDVSAHELLNHIRLPYVPRWSFGEDLPVLEESRGDQLSLTYALETVAALIANDLGDTGLLLRNRQGYVQAATRRGGNQGPRYAHDVFISHGNRDRDFAAALATELSRRGLRVQSGGSHGPGELASTPADQATLRASRNLVAIVSDEIGSALELEYRNFLLEGLSDDESRLLLPVLRGPTAQDLPPTLTTYGGIDASPYRPLREVAAEVARPLISQMVEDLAAMLGDRDPATLEAKLNLATALADAGELLRAREMEEEVVTTAAEDIGPEAPLTLHAQTQLALNLRALGEIDKARALQTQLLDVHRRIFGEADARTLEAMYALAQTLAAVGDLATARALFERVVEARFASTGSHTPESLRAMIDLASTAKALGEFEAALDLQSQVLEAYREDSGPDNSEFIRAAMALAQTLLDVGRDDEAAELQNQIADHQPQPTRAQIETEERAIAPGSGDLRQETIRLLRTNDEVGLEELLRAERRTFSQRSRRAMIAAIADSPGPEIDSEVFAKLDQELAVLLERRSASLLPVMQYRPRLFDAECTWLATLAEEDWELRTPYAAWQQSPRWLAWSLSYLTGAVATGVRQFSAVRSLWNADVAKGGESGLEPLAAMRLLASHEFALALNRSREGRSGPYGEITHLAEFMSRSEFLRENYPETAASSGAALARIGDFSYLLTLLSGRDGVPVIKWWTALGAPLQARLPQDPKLQAEIARDVLDLADDRDLPSTIEALLHEATGPAPTLY